MLEKLFSRRLQQEFGASLKSLDTEDWFDRHIKRPFSFLIAWILAPTGITPNAVTIISMIIGAGSTWFFMHASYHYAGAYGLMMNVIACFMLMFADVLDCVDGQLARLTGRRSKWGRILDGSAGYVWFVPLYLGLVYRFYFHHEIEFRFLGLNDDTVTVWIVTIIVLVLANFAGFMGLGAQSRVVDYLIQGHLLFEKGGELDTADRQQKEFESKDWSGERIRQVFEKTYIPYTRKQEKDTPQFQKMMGLIGEKFGGVEQMPQELRQHFVQGSRGVLKYATLIPFNLSATMLYVCCLLDVPVVTFLFVIIVMGSLTHYVQSRRERLCSEMIEIISQKY